MQAASATCESVAADPQSINLYKDLVEFPDIVRGLARDCPEVLVALDVPIETILATPIAALPDPDDSDANPALPVTEREAAPVDLLAAIRTAQKELDQAVAAVEAATEKVQRATGRVASLSRMSGFERTIRGWSLADLAEKRVEAWNALENAQSELAQRNSDLNDAVVAAKRSFGTADDAHAEAVAKLASVLAGDTVDKKTGALKEDLDAIDKAIAGHEAKIKASNDAIAAATTSREAAAAAVETAKTDRAKKVSAAEAALSEINRIKSKCETSYCNSGDLSLLSYFQYEYTSATNALPALDTKISDGILKVASLDAVIANERTSLATFEAEKGSAAGKQEAIKTTLSDLGALVAKEKEAADAVTLAEEEGGRKVAAARQAVDDAATALEQKMELAQTLSDLTEEDLAAIAEARDLKEDLDNAVAALDAEQAESKQVLSQVGKDASEEIGAAAETLAETVSASSEVESVAVEASDSVEPAIGDLEDAVDTLDGNIDEMNTDS